MPPLNLFGCIFAPFGQFTHLLSGGPLPSTSALNSAVSFFTIFPRFLTTAPTPGGFPTTSLFFWLFLCTPPPLFSFSFDRFPPIFSHRSPHPRGFPPSFLGHFPHHTPPFPGGSSPPLSLIFNIIIISFFHRFPHFWTIQSTANQGVSPSFFWGGAFSPISPPTFPLWSPPLPRGFPTKSFSFIPQFFFFFPHLTPFPPQESPAIIQSFPPNRALFPISPLLTALSAPTL